MINSKYLRVIGDHEGPGNKLTKRVREKTETWRDPSLRWERLSSRKGGGVNTAKIDCSLEETKAK